MPTARLLPLIVALGVFTTGVATSAPAQTPASSPAKAPTQAVKATWGDITFYLAHGDTDACGRGCNEWIVAEGKIDAGAAPRLRRLLAKLGRRKPIMFLHSPGGQILGAIELGRLIREQKLTVSVGRTVPRGCDRDKPSDKACEALKRSGQELAAELDGDIALCASACVYVLAGGSSRLVPPWAKLGIHDIGFDPDRKLPRGAPIAEVKRDLRDKLQNYLREMGFDKLLLTAASAVPNESMKFIERDDIVRFGLDRREFGEAAWSFADKPTVITLKGFFTRALDDGPPLYRNGIATLACVEGRGFVLALGQERIPGEPQFDDPLPPLIGVNGKEIELSHHTTSADLDIRAALVSAGLLDALGDDATLTLFAFAGSEDGSARDVTLSMDGFSAAYARLRKHCNVPVADATTSPRASSTAPAPDFAHNDTTPRPTPPPEPQTIELARTAAAEQRLRLDAIRQDCSIGPMAVSVIEKPQHGAVTIENGEAILCNSKDTLVFYRPGAGYTGADSITLKIAYPLGSASVRHYAIQVR